ncbi:MAG: heavy metal translocating P-type ATPase [Pseudomonadota bacterium]
MNSPSGHPEPDAHHCFHCGEPVPPDADYAVTILGKSRPMCCAGCQAVAQAIVAGGLENYYEHRTALSRTAEGLIPEQLRELDLYDQPRVQESFVNVDEDDVRSASLILEGVTCAACVWLTERYLRELAGVLEFSVNYSTHRARVTWDSARIRLSEILRAIAAIGYIAHPFDPGRQETLQKKERSHALRRMAVAGVGAMQVMMLAVALYAGDYSGMDAELRDFIRWVSMIITFPVVLYSAQEFFLGAGRDLRLKRLGMDVPVSLAIGMAFVASIWATLFHGEHVYFDSVCMFTFFLLTSRFLEMGARHRAGQAAEELVRLLPATATRIHPDGSEEVVAVTELAPGDRVRVRPGETVPADGVVVAGTSSVDESLLTGESMPTGRTQQDSLVGGSVNVESPLEIEVTRVGEDTVVSGIVRLLDRAQSEKPRMARIADRLAAWFVAGVLLVAAGVALWWWQADPAQAFAITLSVLVVTCPCALSLATPVAVTAATGAMTRMGVLATRGHALNTLARATHMVFDKTGTLTRGTLRLKAVDTLGHLSADAALETAAALERHSEHPVAEILSANAHERYHAGEVTAVPGHGVEGRVHGKLYRVGSPSFVAELAGIAPPEANQAAETLVALGTEEGLVATFSLHDDLRPDALQALAEVRELGLDVELLSGDAPGPVAEVARRLRIERRRAGARPADKLAHVRSLQERGAVVAMVGDGVNDAPVLAGSDVSVAMGSGTQLAHASADVVVLSDQLRNLPRGIRLARRTARIVRENLAWAILYNMTAVPLAASGWVAPWMAALGMSASSLVVVLNALRLRRLPDARTAVELREQRQVT